MDYGATIIYKGVNFGVMEGNNGLLIIKTGSGGTIYGHENKYLTMAKKIQSKYGFGVIVSDNPVELAAADNMAVTMSVAKNYWEENTLEKAYYFGVSKGAQYGAMYAYQYDWVTKWLLLNMPLMINWHRSRAGLEKLLPSQQMTMLWGDRDPSYKFIELIDTIKGKNITKDVLPGIDHNLSGTAGDFVELLGKYLFERLKIVNERRCF